MASLSIYSTDSRQERSIVITETLLSKLAREEGIYIICKTIIHSHYILHHVIQNRQTENLVITFIVVHKTVVKRYTMSQRGRGSCPNCKAEYFNRSKPPQCGMCGYALGGTFEPSTKKAKYSPQAVEVSDGIFSVKTSTRDDRCFVTTDGTMWFCSVEGCKIARSVSRQSSRLADFSCRHIDEAKGCKSPSVAILKPNLENISKQSSRILPCPQRYK